MPGITIDINPVAFRLGETAIRWYGIAIMAAVVAGFAFGLREARRRGLDETKVYNLGLLAVFAAIIGARLFHVVDYWQFYRANPAAVLALREGGLSIYGGVAGGILAAWVYARYAKLPFAPVLDAAAPGLIFAQAVGRLGCIVNGDAQGGPASLPWAFTYVHPDALAPQLGVPGHPYPLYEIVWDLLVFALLWQLRGRLRQPGALFLVYAALYALGRLALSLVRQETVVLWGLQQAQVIALGALVVVLPLLVYSLRRPTLTAVRPVAGSGAE